MIDEEEDRRWRWPGTARRRRHRVRSCTCARATSSPRRRRLRPEGPAQARKRADHAPRRRQDLDRLRRTPPDPGDAHPRIRPPRLGRHHRPGRLHAGKLQPPTSPPPAGPARTRSSARASATRSSSSPNRRRSRSPRRSPSSTARRRTATTGPRPRLPRPPGPTTFIVPIVIERIHDGVYGYRTKAKIPKIAGGYGHPISGSAEDRPQMDLQGQAPQLRQRPLRNRAPAGSRRIHLQRRHLSLQGTLFKPCTPVKK